MVFLRIKRIKSKEYAYLVENKWKKGAKQKVKGYIGRVYRFNKKEEKDFLGFKGIKNIEDYVKNNDKNKVIKELLEWEFYRHNIDKEFIVDFENSEVKKGKRGVCIKINDGFLCGHALRNLMEFKAKVDENSNELSFRLGRAFVEAGIEIPHDVFFGLFEKIKGKEDLSTFKDFYY